MLILFTKLPTQIYKKCKLNVLVGQGQEDVFLCADSSGHLLLLVVKLVVAALSAPDQLGQAVFLTRRKYSCFVR